jgi:hypothetical protein
MLNIVKTILGDVRPVFKQSPFGVRDKNIPPAKKNNGYGMEN